MILASQLEQLDFKSAKKPANTRHDLCSDV